MFRPTHYSSMLCVHGLLSSSPGAGGGEVAVGAAMGKAVSGLRT